MYYDQLLLYHFNPSIKLLKTRNTKSRTNLVCSMSSSAFSDTNILRFSRLMAITDPVIWKQEKYSYNTLIILRIQYLDVLLKQ